MDSCSEPPDRPSTDRLPGGERLGALLRVLDLPGERLDPMVVVGFGSYPSVPTVLAAQHLGIKTVIHEQNACQGPVQLRDRTAEFCSKPFSLVRSQDDNAHNDPACWCHAVALTQTSKLVVNVASCKIFRVTICCS